LGTSKSLYGHKLSALARVFATGQGGKTGPVDAHSVAVIALRIKGLRTVEVEDATMALRLLVDHRDELGYARTQTVNRVHRLLLKLLPGGAKKFLSAAADQGVLFAAGCLAGRSRPRRRQPRPTRMRSRLTSAVSPRSRRTPRCPTPCTDRVM